MTGWPIAGNLTRLFMLLPLLNSLPRSGAGGRGMLYQAVLQLAENRDKYKDTDREIDKDKNFYGIRNRIMAIARTDRERFWTKKRAVTRTEIGQEQLRERDQGQYL